MEEIIFLVEESPEGGYTAKGLGVAIFTEGDTIEDLQKNIKEAILCHFDTLSAFFITCLSIKKN
jgi:hypothetical protein